MNQALNKIQKTNSAKEGSDILHLWMKSTALMQDAQKGRPARPQRVKTGGVPSGVR